MVFVLYVIFSASASVFFSFLLLVVIAIPTAFHAVANPIVAAVTCKICLCVYLCVCLYLCVFRYLFARLVDC